MVIKNKFFFEHWFFQYIIAPIVVGLIVGLILLLFQPQTAKENNMRFQRDNNFVANNHYGDNVNGNKYQIFNQVTVNPSNPNTETLDNLKNGQDEIIKLLRKKEENLEAQLKSKYNLGYVLFYTNGEQTFHRTPLNPLNIDWETARIINYSSETIKVLMPSIKDKWHNSGSENTFTILRVYDHPQTYSGMDGIKVTAEYLSDEEDGAFFVIGFSPDTWKSN